MPNSELLENFDVLVVGAGAAGLYAALCLPSHYQVALLNKEPLSMSASDWAQGGMAAAIAPDDSPILHIEDTLKAGAGLCDLSAVDFLAKNAPDCVKNLLELGVAFDRHGSDLALTLEAAHSRRRVLHAADTTGRAVVTTLKSQVLQRSNIKLIAPAFVLSLWINPTTQRCQGVCLVDHTHIRWLRAKAVVLATGGGGQVFAQTTNPSCSTGDGVAIAWRSGVKLRDLEFFQFHPTALTVPNAPRFLISEAVRGEGAHLIDDTGKRFAFDYHPSGELAPRDVVSRAIFSHLQERNLSHVWLDLRSIPVDRIQQRFPNIIQVCQKWGINVFDQPIPVAPAAHYWMGGIVADTLNQTSLPGLYAIGETASTGVHGANRLASNSLLECLVYGGQMANLLVDHSDDALEIVLSSPLTATINIETLPWQLAQIQSWRGELPQLLWRYAGICREGQGLAKAIDQIQSWRSDFINLPISQLLYNLLPPNNLSLIQSELDYPNLQLWGETRNLLDIGYLILKSAFFRTESRGGHFRTDYPLTEALTYHTLIETDQWQQELLATNDRQTKIP